MRKKTSFIALIASAALLVSFALSSFFNKNQVILDIVMSGLDNAHYHPQKLDNSFSEKFFNLYIKRIDAQKMFLTQGDVDNLAQYKTQADDQIKAETFELFDLASGIKVRRIDEKEAWYKEILSKPFDYKTNEEYETDPEKKSFAKNETELKNVWKQYLQYQTIARLNDLLVAQQKIKEVKAKRDTDAVVKPFDSLEVEARSKVLKITNDWFKRLKKINRKDRYAEYINAITAMYDPHTEFFPPKEKKKFDQSMSGQIEGIGARLQQKDDYIKVSEIVVGGPADKQKELKAGDLIIKVAQGSKEPVDIVGMDIDEAIELIKGKKGTEVRLTVKKVDGSTKTIAITRDIIQLDETFAHSAIMQNEKNQKVGYIRLPSFYSDFTRNGAHRCAQDVRTEVEKLKKENVTGIIIDLRDNGGGSLQEVIDMGGLFIKQGPIVQVRKRGGETEQLLDKDITQVYEKPLVIMINKNSASASEIMAAAMQDYRRAVIVGSESFGKGTVQTFLDLDNYLLPQFDSIKPLGSLKITTQKFYRVNGGTTQLRGVTPDITTPDPYLLFDSGEKELDNPMSWDEIPKANYEPFNTIDYPKVQKKSVERIKKNREFTLVSQQAKELKAKKDDSKYSLNLDKFMAEAKQYKEEGKKYEDLRKDIKNFDVNLLNTDVEKITADTIKLNREKKWIENLKKDFYLYEAGNIIGDMQ
ncbi:MAG: carboxy terminal-processing peptidase [Bacteroidetes bacterium]|nr:carboxy terminal-processing peptidase [Bacteroidota bacterium]